MRVVITAVLAIGGLLFVLWVAVRAPFFSSRRASMRSKNLESPNAGLLFAVFGVVQLTLTLADGLNQFHLVVSSTAPLLGALVVALLIALVLMPGANGVLALIGLVAGTAGVFIQYGPPTGLLFVVFFMLALMLCSLVRGLSPRRA